MNDTASRRLVVIPSDPLEAYEKAGYQRLGEYYNPRGWFREVVVVSPFETASRRAHGMEVRQVPERHVRQAIREIRPDVVRAYGGHWPAHLACRNRVEGVPVLVSVHDTRPALLHPSLRYADLVLCVSRVVQEKVIQLGTQPERVRWLPNRVDRSIFRPLPAETASAALADRFPPGRHILHVGRKCRQKNLDTLIRALRLLPDDYQAIFVGRGDAAPYQKLAGRLGVAGRCFWVEAVPNSELPLWYAWCDCLCTPSRWEGFGIVFLEAAACGAVLITSDIAPMKEYLTHGVSAHLVRDYENPRAITAAIAKTCHNADYRRQLAAGAVEAAQPFDRHKVDALEVAIYQEALGLTPRQLTPAERLALARYRVLQQAARLARLPTKALALVDRMWTVLAKPSGRS